jgi:hypothetical protein
MSDSKSKKRDGTVDVVDVLHAQPFMTSMLALPKDHVAQDTHSNIDSNTPRKHP